MLFKKNEPPEGPSRTETTNDTEEEETLRTIESEDEPFQKGVAVNWRVKSAELIAEVFRTKDKMLGLEIANGDEDAFEAE